MHKFNAYRKAAGTVANHPEPITSGSQAEKLSGVGKKIAVKIDEFLATGTLQKLEKIRKNDANVAITLLTRVAGIGPAKAQELVAAGITTLDQLREHKDEKLNNAQRIGLKHFDDFESRIPREEIARVEKLLQKKVRALDAKYTLQICGSYRRGLPSSGDIDVLLMHEDYTSDKSAKANGHLLKRVVEELRECGLITDTISLGDHKFMGVSRLEDGLPFRRLDIMLLPRDQFHCGVLYFTGSDVFNKKMRAHALEHGFTLNEYTLRPLEEGTNKPLDPLPVSSEEDIFDYISYQYREPKDRTGA